MNFKRFTLSRHYSMMLQTRAQAIVLGSLAFCGSLLVSSPARGQTVLANGGNQDGSLASGVTDQYTFSATTGDRVVLQLAKLSGGAGFTPLFELFGPDGGWLMSSSQALAARLDLQAPATGAYTVSVSDVNRTGTGNYRVRLAQVPGTFAVPSGDDGGSMTNGASHTGTIELGDLDLWTISANTGDRITVQVSEQSGGAGFAPMIELYGPDGTPLGRSADAVAARIDAQTVAGGTYTVLVSDRDRSGTGTYQLQLVHLPDSIVVPGGDEGGALADATDTNGSIATGDLDLWSFTANAGDRVTLQITELTGGANFAPQIELFTPSGERKASAQGALSASINVAVESGGTYTLLVSDTDRIGAGTYKLNLTRGSIGPAEASTLTNGALALGSIATAGQTNRWSFTASAGETVVVRIGETAAGAFFPWLRLYGPDGVFLGHDFNGAAAEVAVRATNSGTFVAVVSDGSGGRNQTGGYRISLAKTGTAVSTTASDEGGPLVNGTSYLATIDTGDLDAWTFTANAGENIAVRIGETVAGSALYPWLRIYGPNGALLHQDFNAAAGEVATRATNSGTFLAVVGDGISGLGGSGNYRISLAKTGGQPTISPTDEGGPLVNGTSYLATIDTGDIDAWTFTANTGESILVRIGETVASSALYPWLRIYGPNGALLHQDFNAASAEVTTRATNSGTFLVVVGDGISGLGGSGNYRISLAKTGGQPTISPTDEGGPLVNGTSYLATIDTGDIDAWTFTADTGESILVRMGETDAGSVLYPWLRIYGPSGALLHQDFNAASAEVATRATNSGTFLVVVGDGNSGFGGSGNYRISLAKTGGQPTISPTDEGGPLVNGTSYLATVDTGDIDAWTLTANTGETILLRIGETVASSVLYPWLRIYGPNGALLLQDFNAAAAEVAIRATNSGAFLVVVGDGNSGLGGSGNYRISLAMTGSPLVISAGDEGGSMIGAGVYIGAIDTGDIDTWTFTACAGDTISLRVTEAVSGSPLFPWLRLYGKDGALLRQSFAGGIAEVTMRATNSGTYMVVVADGNSALGGAGNYELSVNGLSDGLKLCVPKISGADTILTGIGGTGGGPFILLSSIEVTTPLNQWSSVLTNQFDFFGVTVVTNAFNLQEPHRFFTLQVP